MRVIWSDFAKDELKNIYLYYKDVAGINIAKKLKNKIFASTKQLRDYPNSGQVELVLREMGDFRYIVIGNYKVIYRSINNDILITDIFDTRQNPKKMNIPRSN